MDYQKVRKECFEFTKQQIRESVNEDDFIVHCMNNVDELNKVANVLSKRLRDWYNLYWPEKNKELSDHEEFVDFVLSKPKHDKNSMGVELKDDFKPIETLAKEIKELYNLRAELKKYAEKVLKGYAPNLQELLGTQLAGKIIVEAGTLKHLAMIPSSTIQMLGAEKALFRHLKTGARPPKHGIIIQHPYVASSRTKGKAARTLADKISIAVRSDFFKGKFIAPQLKKDLEAKK